ncbi:YrdB family protein [Telluribacter sp. SYSU D00476]|uniref:YrdB family protein n=1 Tax=Telluribacter sp. SYSU D00476 TaxID=2811430 RepID=UPI001FF16DF2|nr:YrdB family protein [Telluribacter sp. SYSU D00476]
MSQHPINLGIRFLLEIAALVAVGMWGWQKPEGNMRYVLVVLLPVLLAALWGVFRVPNDPGVPPVQVSGVVRLLIEAFVFGSAVAALYDLGQLRNSIVLAGLLLVHYLVSYDRVQWLLRQ